MAPALHFPLFFLSFRIIGVDSFSLSSSEPFVLYFFFLQFSCCAFVPIHVSCGDSSSPVPSPQNTCLWAGLTLWALRRYCQFHKGVACWQALTLSSHPSDCTASNWKPCLLTCALLVPMATFTTFQGPHEVSSEPWLLDLLRNLVFLCATTPSH